MPAKNITILIIGLALGLLVARVWPQIGSHKQADLQNGHQHPSQENIYTCPMHPEIRQKGEGTCPICHMALVPVENSVDDSNSTLSEIVVPLNPYQASLVGIKPIHPQQENVVWRLPVYGTLARNNILGVQVFEENLRNITIGLPFIGQSAVYPEIKQQGKVIQMDQVLDPSTRTLRVLIRLIPQKGQNQLPVESSVTGHLLIPLGEQLTLPEEAIFFAGTGSYVYLYNGERLTPQKVILGAKVEGRYVIVDGLSASDAVSSGPNFLIDSEAKIRGLDDSKMD